MGSQGGWRVHCNVLKYYAVVTCSIIDLSYIHNNVYIMWIINMQLIMQLCIYYNDY